MNTAIMMLGVALACGACGCSKKPGSNAPSLNDVAAFSHVAIPLSVTGFRAHRDDDGMDPMVLATFNMLEADERTLRSVVPSDAGHRRSASMRDNPEVPWWRPSALKDPWVAVWCKEGRAVELTIGDGAAGQRTAFLAAWKAPC